MEANRLPYITRGLALGTWRVMKSTHLIEPDHLS
jgi:hypothetical protein